MRSAAGWRRWVTWQNAVMLAIALWAAPRLLPHIGALIGVRTAEARRPSISVVTRDGRVITSDSLKGRVVLVNVWATWCAPCRVEMPALQQIADQWAGDSLVVLGLSVDRGPADEVDRFLADRGITYPVAIVNDGTIAQMGGVRGYPTSFLLDREGVVRHAVMGPIGVVTLRPAIWRLLREPRGDL